MAITVEDGTGKTDANSYVELADLTTYATNRGKTVSGGEELLHQAMDYIEAQNYQGDKYTDAQALQWPRVGVELYGYDVDSDEIPQLLKDAQMEVALSIDAGIELYPNLERITSSETVGPISVTYEKGSREIPYLAAVQNKLLRLLAPNSIKVIRA